MCTFALRTPYFHVHVHVHVSHCTILCTVHTHTLHFELILVTNVLPALMYISPIQMKLQATEHEQERLSLQQQLQAQSTAKQKSVTLQHVHVHVCMYSCIGTLGSYHSSMRVCGLHAIMCMCLHTCTCFVQTKIRHKKQCMQL